MVVVVVVEMFGAVCCADPVLMSDTTAVYRTSQQIGSGQCDELLFGFALNLYFSGICLQCSDAVGWAAGRASGL